MKTIMEYLKELEHFVVTLGGDSSILDEYTSHLKAEFAEFSSKINSSLPPILIEQEFVEHLEPPEGIARSLMGISLDKPLYLNKWWFPMQQDFIKTIQRSSFQIQKKWDWYSQRILSNTLGFSLTVMSIWLILGFVIIPIWYVSLLIEVNHVIIFPFSSKVYLINYYSSITLHLMFIIMTAYLSSKYSLIKVVSTYILSAWAYSTILVFYGLSHKMSGVVRISRIGGNIVEETALSIPLVYIYLLLELITISLVVHLLVLFYVKLRPNSMKRKKNDS